RSDLAIAIAAVLPGKLDNIDGETPLVVMTTRDLALRRAMLPERRTGTTDVSILLRAADVLAWIAGVGEELHAIDARARLNEPVQVTGQRAATQRQKGARGVGAHPSGVGDVGAAVRGRRRGRRRRAGERGRVDGRLQRKAVIDIVLVCCIKWIWR